MNSDLRQRLLELELDIVALEVDLHLQVVRSLPLPATPSPVITWTNLWLCHFLPSVLPEVPIPISMASRSPGTSQSSPRMVFPTHSAERSSSRAER